MNTQSVQSAGHPINDFSSPILNKSSWSNQDPFGPVISTDQPILIKPDSSSFSTQQQSFSPASPVITRPPELLKQEPILTTQPIIVSQAPQAVPVEKSIPELIKEAASNVVDTVKDTVVAGASTIVNKTGDALIFAKDGIVHATEVVKDTAVHATEVVNDTVIQPAKNNVAHASEVVKDTAVHAAEAVQQKTLEIKDSINQTLEQTRQTVVLKAEGVRDMTAESAANAKLRREQESSQLQRQGYTWDNAKTTANETIQDVKESIINTKESAEHKLQDAKSTVENKVQGFKEDAKQKIWEAEPIQMKANELEAKLHGTNASL